MKVPKRDWLTASEVAAMFEVTPQSVRLWILTGQLDGEQAHKGTWLIHESAIEQFKAQRHAANTLPPARGGELSSRPSVRSGIDPSKRYKIKGTGEVITGAELLLRRAAAGTDARGQA